MMNDDELLFVMTSFGKLLLENGAETYRIEDSTKRIALAYGVKAVDVYAASTSIMITIITAKDQSLSRVKRISNRVTNLDKIECLNRLCRNICETTPNFIMVNQSLRAISLRPNYHYLVQVIGYAATASIFTLFFGGSPIEALCALLIGGTIKVISYHLNTLKTNPLFITIICSNAISILTLIFYHLEIIPQIDHIIIGAIMPLVPGVALTNSIRDLMAGDFVAGQAKLTEAILIATCIAIGIGIPLSMR